mmetsp:Transcript_40218/g.129285  ORF Transcript_40218/g.129285 Transcript_40218/m.129285 type:complete len:281 (+) Transcript_40218:133-975(+)
MYACRVTSYHMHTLRLSHVIALSSDCLLTAERERSSEHRHSLVVQSESREAAAAARCNGAGPAKRDLPLRSASRAVRRQPRRALILLPLRRQLLGRQRPRSLRRPQALWRCGAAAGRKRLSRGDGAAQARQRPAHRALDGAVGSKMAEGPRRAVVRLQQRPQRAGALVGLPRHRCDSALVSAHLDQMPAVLLALHLRPRVQLLCLISSQLAAVQAHDLSARRRVGKRLCVERARRHDDARLVRDDREAIPEALSIEAKGGRRSHLVLVLDQHRQVADVHV